MKENESVLLKQRRNKQIDKRKYFLIYTVIFSFLCLLVFYNYIINDVTLIRSGDGYLQHYTSLEYYGKWLRQILRNLFVEHKFDIPMWDFSIGMGSDIITTFNYYVIGDPLTFLSVFVPENYTPHLFTFLCIVRYYLIGFTFSLYCFERKHSNIIGVLAGAFTYTFCSYAIYAATKHPYFINPMIYLPIILICVEKIFKKQNPIWLALIVCVCEVSNFYFFYVIVLATVVYVFFRLGFIYKTNFKAALNRLIRIGISSVIGVLLGAVIFLPVVVKLLSDSRFSVSYEYTWFYPLEYYLRFLASFITHDYWKGWTLLGFATISLFSIFSLFITRKKNTCLKIIFTLCILGMMTPKFGSLANGFSYACNRWGFVFSLVIGYVVSQNWNRLFVPNKIHAVIITALSVVFSAINFFNPYAYNNRTAIILICTLLISACILACSFLFKDNRKKRNAMQLVVLAACFISITANAQFCFKDTEQYYLTVDKANTYSARETSAVKQVSSDDDEFFRYTGDNLGVNTTVRDGLHSTQYYWSLSDKYISELHDSFNLNEILYQWYNGFDDITCLSTLSSVKYYYDYPNKNTIVPYGFEKTSEENLYENKNFLPIGYTYDTYILRSDFDKLENSIQKQQSLLRGAVVNSDVENIKKETPVNSESKLDYEIIETKAVKFDNNTFCVNEPYSLIYLKVKPEKNCETYISFKGFDFKGDEDAPTLIKLNVGSCDSSGKFYSSKQFSYSTNKYTFYCGKHDFDINIGYSEDGYTTLGIQFPFNGSYSFDELNVYFQPMDIYDENVKKLGQEVLENVIVDMDKVSGTIDVSTDKLLVLSIPYSKGWKAYVDGEKVDILNANIMHMALNLTEGRHEIELKYSTPYMKTGAVISVLGFVLLLSYGLWYNKKSKRLTNDLKRN